MALKWWFGLVCSAIATFSAVTPAVSAITYQQGNSGASGDTETSISATFAGAQTAGNLNVVVIGWSSSTVPVASIADSSGNSYSVAAGPEISPSHATAVIYYAKNINAAAANANTVTVTFASSAGYPDIRIAEYAGIDTVSPLNATSGGTGTSNAMDSGNSTTTSPDVLLIAGNYIEWGTDGIDPNFTQRLYTAGSQVLEDRIVSSTGTYSAAAHQYYSGWWIMQMAAFKAAGGGSGDVTAPTVPSGVNANVISSTQIDLSWSASTDAVGVTGYQVDRCAGASCTNFAQIATPTSASFTDTTVVASTSYRYRIRARDAVPNWSAYSSVVSATTSAGPDTIAPTVPTGLTATTVSTTQIIVSWIASTDAVGVTGYTLERCKASSCVTFTPTTTSYNDTGLIAASAYTYRVKARDAAGNFSNYTTIVNASTSGSGGVVECD